MLGELGYGVAYRILDAQHVRTRRFPWAVPQRRRRVFVVGYLGDWRRAAAVLFDRESLSGLSPPRREAGQGLAADIAPSLTCSGRGVERVGDTRGQDPLIATQGVALRGRVGGATAELTGPVSTALRSSQGGGDKPYVVSPVYFDGGRFVETFDRQSSGEYGNTPVARTISARDHKSATDLVAHTLRGAGFDASEDGTGRGTPIIPISLQSVAFDSKGTQVQFSTDGAASTLRSMSHNASHQNAGGHSAIATAYAVRRLTPVECERLMGFPDNFTRIPWGKKSEEQCPDGHRYKSIGNSWAVNCADWIGQRIAVVNAWPAQNEIEGNSHDK